MDEIYVKCPACNKKQRHKIIRVKDPERGLAICKCTKCGSLSYSKIKKESLEIMLILSEGGKAKKRFEKFPVGAKFKKGDCLKLKDERFEIRSIESNEGGRLEEGGIEQVRTIWIAPYTKQLSISVHQKGGSTVAYRITKGKDERIKKGDVLELEGKKVEVTRIMGDSGDKEQEGVSRILALHGRFL
ncbi:MAG: hypothetical protein JXB14_00330 [Candidatus Altiarchaeota archaeon]|nr:hypothetical protein [Candidatus Altiarchaeota archaeon]